MLFILSLGVFVMPASASAYTRFSYTAPEVDTSNPKPSISYITPRSIEQINGKVTITVSGYGFTPNSVVRKNNSNRNTTFIDSKNLLVDIYANDVYNQSEFFLTVYNGEPGGGYSNASLFTIKNKIPATTSTVTNTSSTNNTSYNYNYNNNDSTRGMNSNSINSSSASDVNESYGSLTANALVGSSGNFMPTGLAQWIFLIIIICAIIFLWRYVHRSSEAYMAEPMKHA